MVGNLLQCVAGVFGPIVPGAKLNDKSLPSDLNENKCGGVAQVFDLAAITNTAGAPSFAHFAKGGYDAAGSELFPLATPIPPSTIAFPQLNSSTGT